MRIMIGVGVIILSACAGPQSAPVPVRGEMSFLAGEWRGSYESQTLARSGSIVFTLVPGEDHAHGDVVMVPAGFTAPLRPAELRTVLPAPGTAQTLTIQFVRAAGDSVTGTLAPYYDPECDCTASASFTGRVEGNTIRGTFVTRRSSGSASGTWSVRRRG